MGLSWPDVKRRWPNVKSRRTRIRRRPIPDTPSKRGLFLLPKHRSPSKFDITLTSTPISGQPRKLRVRWDVDN
jgi:hypothetical protein